MSLKFTSKAGHETVRLCKVQKRIAELRAELKQQQAVEDEIQTFLKSYFDVNSEEEVQYGRGTLLVKFTQTDRFITDSAKVEAFYEKMGKTVPKTVTTVTSFTVKQK